MFCRVYFAVLRREGSRASFTLTCEQRGFALTRVVMPVSGCECKISALSAQIPWTIFCALSTLSRDNHKLTQKRAASSLTSRSEFSSKGPSCGPRCRPQHDFQQIILILKPIDANTNIKKFYAIE
jgi:hypothetical protein